MELDSLHTHPSSLERITSAVNEGIPRPLWISRGESVHLSPQHTQGLGTRQKNYPILFEWNFLSRNSITWRSLGVQRRAVHVVYCAFLSWAFVKFCVCPFSFGIEGTPWAFGAKMTSY